MHLPIIFEDENLIAINKPHNLLVHRSSLSRQDTIFAVQELRNQCGHHVFPIHRLDRKVSGVLLFGKTSEAAAAMQNLFITKEIEKNYLAIVRGFFPHQEVIVDHPVMNERKNKLEAVSKFKLLESSEIPLPFGKHSTSRYSIVEARPITGKYHQLRQHLKHLKHPIIGDRPHGCNKQNKLFLEKWNMTTTMLHAESLVFKNPFSLDSLCIQAPISQQMKEMIQNLNFSHKFSYI